MGTLIDIDRGPRLLSETHDLDGLELCAVASGLFQDGDPHGYGEVVESLQVMCDRSEESALYSGVWRLLELSGWVSSFDHCWICGNEVERGHAMMWHEGQLGCRSCGSGAEISASMRRGVAAHLQQSNVRLNQRDISSWRKMIQDVLRQHGVRALSSINQEYS